MQASGQATSFPWYVRPAAALVRIVLRLVFGTCRLVEISGEEHLDALARSGRASVFAFWHNRSSYCGDFLRKRWLGAGRPLGIITSLSRDGEIAARAASTYGLAVARGSVGGGGLAGLKSLHRMLTKNGISVLCVADGSRGPIYEAQAGVIVLAQTARAPLVPLSYVASRCWRLRSWDRMIVPKPFSRIVLAIGDPIEYPDRLDKEGQNRAQSALKKTLDDLTERAAAALEAS